MYGGFCKFCRQEHKLDLGSARFAAQDLFNILQDEGRLDFEVAKDKADPALSLDYLWGRARGQMFGVLSYIKLNGESGILKAFSGQFNGIWQVTGWVPPVFNLAAFDDMVEPVEREIKLLGRLIADETQTEKKQEFKLKRRQLSQKLMFKIHTLYELNNFKGQAALMTDIFQGLKPGQGMPTGTGDCCAPKLLHYAATHGLYPTGLAEFYFGRENKSGTRVHGQIYPSCNEKCRPILGFLLCGLKFIGD